MKTLNYIPRRTQHEISSPAPQGDRHNQMVRVAVSLTGQGLSPEAVFAQLRSMHSSEDFDDFSIQRIVRWAAGKGFQPCTAGYFPSQRPLATSLLKVTPENALAEADRFLAGFRCDEGDLWHSSPWRPGKDWRKDSALLIAALYNPADRINIVTDFITEKDAAGCIVRACPCGAGLTLTRDEWLEYLKTAETPQSAAGAYIRINPVSESGTGASGSFCDEDIATFRFMLLESDCLSLDVQCAFFARLPLPVVAIISSGGKSAHAWIKIESRLNNTSDYRELAKHILARLASSGFDTSHVNPSRMSRLPGAARHIGGRNDNRQRLLYLNPDASGSASIF